jgi:multiple sugar transport system ATP-binding protein
MGSPAMNLLDADIIGGGDGLKLSIARKDGSPLTMSVPTSVAAGAIEAGKKVVFGIRPEAITDEESADRHAGKVEVVPGLVDLVEPAGSDTFVVTHLAGKPLVSRMRSDAAVKAGTTMPFAFNLDKALLFDPQSGLRL